jgi:hypothetical protein
MNKSMELNNDKLTETTHKNIYPRPNQIITQLHYHTNKLHRLKPQTKQKNIEIRLAFNINIRANRECKEPRKQQSNVSTGNDGNREQEIGRCRTMYLLESIASRQQEIERKEDVDNSQRSYKLDIDSSRYMRQRSR